MDRRRFVPSLTGLEVRELLTVAIPTAHVAPAVAMPTAATATPAIDGPAAAAPAVTAADPTDSMPVDTAAAAPPVRVHQIDPSIQPLRNQRIERLPALLHQLDRQRHVPPSLVTALQKDLELIRNQLTPPPARVLAAFNEQLRSLLASTTITAANVRRTNEVFGAVLRQSSAPEDLIARFQADMNELARFDVPQRNPSVLLANDYALITQMCMGIGINIVVVPTAQQTRIEALIAARESHRAMLAQNHARS